MSAESRFEARPHPTSTVPGILAAWDYERGDWAREPGPDRKLQVFVSEAQIGGWAERQQRPAGQP